MRTLAIATVLLVGACTRADAPDDAAAAEPAAVADGPLEIDERDQYALLVEIETALGNGLDRDGNAMAKVRSAWIGRRFRWEVGFVPVFCATHERCNVTPFDHGHRPDRRIRQGFMPELALDEAGFAAVQAACKDHSRCVLKIEATLGRFAFSPEEATALRFDDVEVRGARAARPDESWIVSRVPARGRS